MCLNAKVRLPKIYDGFLYHFTTSDSLMKILQGMSLKLSTFSNLNDLNETELCCSHLEDIDYLKIKRFIVKKCKLLSFSQNFQFSDGDFQDGYNHPRMWAQYAHNNTGACLVINEERFLKINEKALKDKFTKVENVVYSPHCEDGNMSEDTYDPKKFVEKHFKFLFFNKHIDWIQEDERRFFCICGPPFLSILGCVEFICLGKKFCDEDYHKLAIVLTTKSNKCFRQLLPHNFKLQNNRYGRVAAVDSAGTIIRKISELGNGIIDYMEHLKQNGYPPHCLPKDE